MKIAGHFLFYFLILTSCRTPSQIEIAKFANRPMVNDPCISNGDGTCYRNGELIEDTLNYAEGPIEDYDKMLDHVERLEKYYYYCKKFQNC